MKQCNLDYLKSITPNDNDFAIQVLTLFLQDTPISLQGIKDELKAENWVAIHSYTHKIKPSIEIVGLPKKLVDELFQINDFAKSETNTDKISDILISFEKGLVDVIKELEEALIEMKA